MTKYSASAFISHQGNQILNLDLGEFDTKEQAETTARNHMKTVGFEDYDVNIEYTIYKIENYDTDDETAEEVATYDYTGTDDE